MSDGALNIIVVEDEKQIRRFVRAALEAEGFRVFDAETGRQGLGQAGAGKPDLVMRETTERPEGVSAGTAKLVGTDAANIVTEIFTLLDDKAAYESMARAHNPFGDGHSARRIVELVANEIRSKA